MSSMPVGMSAGDKPAYAGPRAVATPTPTGPGTLGPGTPDGLGVPDVLVDRLDELDRRGRRRWSVERACDVERRTGRRESRRLLRFWAGATTSTDLDLDLDDQSVVPAVAALVELDQGAELALLVQPLCDVCRVVPGVRRVVFVDAVVALVCRGCGAGAVAGVAA